jgi:two-component system OmpR family response regulator
MANKGKKVRIFSALEVANICGVVNQTAINWIKSKYLKAFTTPGGQYRVYADDLYHFLHSRGMRIPDELDRIMETEQKYRKILIVDDDADLNNLLLRYFTKTRKDNTILQAFDGFEAGRLLSETKPGVVILDINLPGIDGHKLCRKIKADANLGNPLVIAITGIPDPTLEETIIHEGADAFMAKPFTPDKLSQTINELLGIEED